MATYERKIGCENSIRIKLQNDERDHTILFLKCLENYFNELLRVRGYVFLDEVYAKFGIYDQENPSNLGWNYNNSEGDGYVHFEIEQISKSEEFDVTFNYDGYVFV